MNPEIQFFGIMLDILIWTMAICGALGVIFGRLLRGLLFLFGGGYVWTIVWLGDIGIGIHLFVMVALGISLVISRWRAKPNSVPHE